MAVAFLARYAPKLPHVTHRVVRVVKVAARLLNLLRWDAFHLVPLRLDLAPRAKKSAWICSLQSGVMLVGNQVKLRSREPVAKHLHAAEIFDVLRRDLGSSCLISKVKPNCIPLLRIAVLVDVAAKLLTKRKEQAMLAGNRKLRKAW